MSLFELLGMTPSKTAATAATAGIAAPARPASTPSPPNSRSPDVSPRGPLDSYAPGGAPISPPVVSPELRPIVYELMERSEVPPQYRDQLAPYIAKHLLAGRKMPPDQRNTDDVLAFLSTHTCVKTWVRKAFEDYEQRKKRFTREEAGNDGEGEKFLLDTMFDLMGMVLGQGFNYVQEPPGTMKFFERKIVGIKNMDKDRNKRFTECDAALRVGEPLLPDEKRPDKPSAGKRKKTKKNKTKKRKTLRRRKLHR